MGSFNSFSSDICIQIFLQHKASKLPLKLTLKSLGEEFLALRKSAWEACWLIAEIKRIIKRHLGADDTFFQTMNVGGMG